MVEPGLFSTTTGWPQRSCSCDPIRRPEMSSGPPGGKGTTSRTGFDGNSCPCPSAQAVRIQSAKATPSLMAPPPREARLSEDGHGPQLYLESSTSDLPIVPFSFLPSATRLSTMVQSPPGPPGSDLISILPPSYVPSSLYSPIQPAPALLLCDRTAFP